MNPGARCVAGAAMAAAWLAGCTSAKPPPAAAAAAPSAAEACRTLIDSLAAVVPPGQSLAELQARGIRVRNPLRFPPGAVQRPLQSSGAAVQMMINPDGTVVPGSPKTVKAVGEPQVAAAMEAGALSMSFDLDGAAAKPASPIPYVTTFAVCIPS
jgi:hypothetical protein